MRREGRQHGMVRVHTNILVPSNPRPNRVYPNELTAPPTAGHFTKVSTKPTNHSKFTGKCGRPMCRGCHDHPACKSKNKVKGAHKVRSSSYVGLDYGLVTRRVVDAKTGLKSYGLSTKGILDYLDSDDYEDCDYENEYHEHCDVEVEELGSYNHEIEEIGQCDVRDHGVDGGGNNDDQMSFFEVGFVWQPVDGDEDWCLVEEM